MNEQCRIISMRTLTPIMVEYTDSGESDRKQQLVLVDFVSDKIWFSNDFHPDGNSSLFMEIEKIVNEKKNAALSPYVPEDIINKAMKFAKEEDVGT